jgi:hypothetical protein
MAIHLEQCTFVGGCGYPFAVGQQIDVRFSSDAIRLQATNETGAAEIFYPELVDLTVTGPGAVTTGGGFIGGGFGFEGALKGMAIATVLNLLTSRTKVHTFLQLVTHQGEVFLHYGGLEPGAVRIVLSPVFTHLRRTEPGWLDTRLQRLDALRAQGAVSEEQFASLKARLLAAPRLSGLEDIASPTLATVKCTSCGASVFASLDTCDVCGKPLAPSSTATESIRAVDQ